MKLATRYGLLFVSLAGSLCAQPCRLPELGGSAVYPGLDGGRFCAPAGISHRQASWQVLIDDSGSMRGVVQHIEPLLRWLDQALSHLRGLDLAWTGGRTCFFSTSRPFSDCVDGMAAGQRAAGRGETTLDVAIRESRRADLTFLITDGAAASGSGRGDCAAGVDAACFGRSLAETLRPAPGERIGAAGGAWLMPLAVLHRGPFFTEQPLNPAGFDAAATAKAIANDLGVTVSVRNPRSLSDGTLAFDYEGPRVLLLIVLARTTEMGRSAIAALQARMEFSGITAADSLAHYAGGVRALPAIELFPGAARGLSWEAVRVAEPTCGSILARLRSDGRLEAGCAGQNASAVIRLRARTEPESKNCARILMLPFLEASASFPPVHADRRAFRSAAWSGSALDPAHPIELRLVLECSRLWNQSLSGNCKTAAEVWLKRSLARTVSELTGRGGNRAAPRLLRELSATSVMRAPHRAFQLLETLERFYISVQTLHSDQPKLLGTVELCGVANSRPK